MAGKIKKSLVYSFWDGFFASIQFAIVDQFATPLALFFGAGSVAIGFLNFIRNALVSIIQIKSADITALIGSRKKLITFSVFCAALLWIPTFFVPFLFPARKVEVFILLFAVTSSFNMLASPAWASLMAEYIPSNKRGRYFGWRGMVLGIVYSISVIAAGMALQWFDDWSLFWGFAALIIVAAVFRFVSWFFLTLQFEPKLTVEAKDYFSLWDFLRRAPWSNFARFAIFSSLLLFGVSMVSPFFAVYVLQELHFNYLQYTLIATAAVVTSFVTQRYWGFFTDKYGNMKIIKLTAFYVSFIPLLWFVSSNFYYLFLVQLLAGFVWAGFNLASTNFIYDVAVPAKRERCISYFNFLLGVGTGVGALLGGWIYSFWGSFFLLIFISFLIRLISFVLIRYFSREVRKVENVRIGALLFDLSGMRGTHFIRHS